MVTSLLLGVLLLPVFARGTIPEYPLDDNKKTDTPKVLAESKKSACGRFDSRFAELDRLYPEETALFYCTPTFKEKRLP